MNGLFFAKYSINRNFLLAMLMTILVSTSVSHATEETGEHWWQQAYPQPFDLKRLSKKQSFISVKGNQLVNEQGQPFLLKGVNIADPDKLIKQSQWRKGLFQEIKDWGANVIRLPIHPVAWRSRGEKDYLAVIDQAVEWANQLDLYLIVDWHSIGYLPTEQFQHEMYDTTIKETRAFWKTIAFRYQNVPTIAVYELFNEPTDLGGKAGQANWQDWKQLNEELIDIIYAHDKNVIPLVAGFNWAYDLRPLRTAPVEREGVAYAVHPYPQKAKPEVKSKENFFALWEEVWGFAAQDYPLIATELGWVDENGYGAHIPVINDGSYGPHIVEFMAMKNISYTVWVFDPDWSPTMINNWQFEPSEQGAFFKQVLKSTTP